MVRTLERDVGGLTAANPYTGTTQPIANYLADPAEEAILHMVNADPARTPTFAMFAKPDYFLSPGSASLQRPCVTQNTGFAWDHGDYAAEIDTNWLGLAGPGVKNLGPRRRAADAGPELGRARTAARSPCPTSAPTGPWVDETDIRPTIMYLTGLRDDYEHDGRVITQVLANPNRALQRPGRDRARGVLQAAQLQRRRVRHRHPAVADDQGHREQHPGDAAYLATDQALRGLEVARDRLAGLIKGELENAAFGTQGHQPGGPAGRACQGLIIHRADQLASAAS